MGRKWVVMWKGGDREGKRGSSEGAGSGKREAIHSLYPYFSANMYYITFPTHTKGFLNSSSYFFSSFIQNVQNKVGCILLSLIFFIFIKTQNDHIMIFQL